MTHYIHTAEQEIIAERKKLERLIEAERAIINRYCIGTDRHAASMVRIATKRIKHLSDLLDDVNELITAVQS